MTQGRARGANSGRTAVPSELKRSECVRMQVTPGDKADLEHIAAAWGVPIATAAYAMVATALASARGQSLSSSVLPIEAMASIRILASQRRVREQGKQLEAD